MHARGVWFVVLAQLAWGCARGYEVEQITRAEQSPAQLPILAQPAPDAGPIPQAEQGYSGEACAMGETQTCVCSNTGTEGIKTCLFDTSSPTRGTFSDCRNCAAPAPPDGGTPGDVPDPRTPEDDSPDNPSQDCADGEQNGTETDVDCGGPDCPSCLIGGGCNMTTDCSAGECVSGRCELPAGSGDSGGGNCSSPCTQICFPVGILPCCNALGVCGCTWAPGAYCL